MALFLLCKSVRLFLLSLIGLAILCGGCAASADHRDWANSYGGLELGPLAVRAQRIVDRLETGLEGRSLQVKILRTDSVSAFSFPDGSIFVTRGLMARADDDVVAAVVAHEMGHLLSDGHLQGPVALRGNDKGLDVEAKADAVGCKVLEMHGVSSTAMTRMLQLVVANTPSRQCCDDLCLRICRLQSQAR